MREIRNIALLFILTIPNLFCAEQVSRLIIHAAVGFAGVGIGMFGGDFYGIVVLLCPVEGYGYGLFRLVINGRDLKEMGIAPGKQMGHILEYLLEKVLEAPHINTRENLEKMVADKYLK